MKYGITSEELKFIRNRDKTCVYCHKTFDIEYKQGDRKDSATIEHLNHRNEWDSVKSYHAEGKPVPEIIAICCYSCNTSRKDKSLTDWFKREYCTSKNISYETVDDVVKRFIDMYEPTK